MGGQGHGSRGLLRIAAPGPEDQGLPEGAGLQAQPAAQLLPGHPPSQGELAVVGGQGVLERSVSA